MKINLGLVGYSYTRERSHHELWARIPLGLHWGETYHMVRISTFTGWSYAYLLRTWDRIDNSDGWRRQRQVRHVPLNGKWRE